MAEITEVNVAEIDARLDNLTRKSQCENVVCPGLLVPALCDGRAHDRCLVPYHYPMTLDEVAEVAERADYARRVEEADMAIAAQEEAEEVPTAPFRPDWRFWTGVTLSGLGLFLYRNR